MYFDKGADTMYIADNPTGHTMEATVVDRGVVSSADDVTIRGASIEKFAYNGIGTAANRWTIDNSKIRYVHLSGISLGGTVT